MMGMVGYGYGDMMGGGGLVGVITHLVILVDLILVGMWLWQSVSKK